jgi:hypothetical protein
MKKFTIFFLMVFMYAYHGYSSPGTTGMLANNYTDRADGVYAVNRVNATQNLVVRIEGPEFACSNAMVTLHAVFVDTDPFTTGTTYSYTWLSSTSHGGGFSGVAGAQNIQELHVNMSDVTPVRYYKVVVQRMEGSACVGPADTSAVFMLRSVDRGTVTITGTPEHACTQQTLTATTTSPATVDHWVWMLGSNVVANTGTSNTYVATTAGDYKAIAVYQGSDLCNDTSAVYTVDFTGATPPTLNVEFALPPCDPTADPIICPGGQLLLTATGGAAPYTFYRNGALLGSSNSTWIDNPYDAGTVSYTVVDAGGCSATNADFSVETPITPVIGSPGQAVFCTNSTANISLTSNYEGLYVFVPECALTWSVDGAAGNNGSATTISGLAPSDRPYEIVLNLNDAALNCHLVSEPLLVSVYPMPTATLTTTPACYDAPGTATVTVNGYVSDYPTYTWSTGVTGTGATAVSGNLTAPLGVTVTVTGNAQCSATATATIEVLPEMETPVVKIEGGATNVLACNGAPIHVEATGLTGTNYIYTWYRNGQLLPATTASFVDNVENNSNAETEYTYTLVLTTTDNCGSKTAASPVVTVFPQTEIVITGPSRICEGTTANYHAVGAPEIFVTASNGWTWFVDENIQTGENLPILSIDLAAQQDAHQIYAVMGMASAIGCRAMASDIFFTQVDPMPIVSINASDSALCEGGSVTLMATTSDETIPGVTYTWEFGGSEVGTGATYVATEAGVYTVHMTQHYPGTSSCKADTTFEVKARTMPTVDLTTNPAGFVCSGSQVELTATATLDDAAGTAIYTWYRNGLVMGTTTTASYYDEVATGNDTTLYIYSVTVEQPTSGCVAHSTPNDTIRVNHIPSVSISGDQLLCGNPDQNTVNLTATLNDTIAGTYNLVWREDNVNTTQTGYTFSKAKDYREYPYIYTVAVTGPDGCVVVSDPYPVYVNDTIVVGVNASSNKVCAGKEVVLNAAVQDNFDQVTFRWYTVNGTTETEIPNEYTSTLVQYPTANTIYRVRVLQNSTFCTAQGDTAIEVVTAPTMTLAVTPAGTDSICEGGQFTLELQPSDVAPAGTYNWYKNNNLVATNTNNYFTDSPVAIDGDRTMYTYAVQFVQDSTGCEAFQYDTVYVFPNLNVVISGDQTVCDGEFNVNLTATVNGMAIPSTNVTATWYRDGIDASTLGTITNGTDNSVYVANHDAVRTGETSSTYIYSVEISRGNGCTTLSADYPVTVYSAPLIQMTANDTTICAGGDVTFTANVTNNNIAGLSYEWKVNNVVVDGAASNTMTYLFQDASEYVVVVNALQNLSGCTATDTIKVTPKEQLTVNIDANNDTVCAGQQIMVAATPTSFIAAEPITYTWYKNGAVMENETDSVIYDTPEAQSIYGTTYVYGVAISQPSSACGSVIVYDTVSVKAHPTVAISGDAMICHNDSIGLVAHVNDYDETMGELHFQWRLANADITGATNDTLSETNRPASNEPYIYTVVVTNENAGCAVESDPYYVYVNDTLNVVVTSDYDSICENAEITLTAHLGDYNSENLIYRWFAEDVEIPGATERVITVVPQNVGVNHYRVDLLQTTSECAASGKDSVKVLAAPDLTLDVNMTMVCSGGEVTLVASATQEGTFAWYKNGVLIEGATQQLLMDSPIAIDGDSTAYVYSVVFSSNIPGCMATKDTIVYAYPNPTIVISGDPIICDGNNIDLTANINGYDTTTTNVHYQWMLANTNLTDASATTNHLTYLAANSTDPYQFTVMAYDNSGCRSISDIYYVYVNDSIQVVVTADDTTICENGTVTLTANLGDYNDDALIYQWYTGSVAPANAIAGATSATLTTNVSATETYYVEVIQTTSDCHASGSQTIHTEQAPAIANITLSDTAVCDAYQIQITATIDPAQPGIAGEPYIYTWYRNGQLIEGVTDSTFMDAAPLTNADSSVYVYSATVRQASSSCVSEMKTSAQSLTVFSLPTVQLSGDASLCYGDTVILWAHIQNHNAVPFDMAHITWAWLLDNNDVSSNPMLGNMINPGTIYYKENRINDVQTEPYNYSIRINAGHGCTVTSDPYPVTIFNLPDVYVTVDDATICEGGEITATANIGFNNTHDTAFYDANDLTYVWSVDGTVVDGAVSSTLTTTLTTAGTIPVKVQVLANSTRCLKENAVNVEVSTIPVISSIELSSNDICEGTQVTVTGHASDGVTGEAYIYTWYRNGEVIEGVTDSTFVDAPVLSDVDANSFVYTAVVRQASAGCTSLVAASDTLTVSQNPTVMISGDAILCKDSTVILDAHINDTLIATGALTYQWRMFNDNLIDGGDTTGATTDHLEIAHMATQDEPYIFTVEVANDNGCRSLSEPYYVYVNDTILVEVTADFDSVCTNGAVTLTANLGNYNTDNLVYRWYTVEGSVETEIVGATSRELTVHPEATTDYLVRVMQTTSECEAEGTKQIKVIDLPELTLTLVPQDTICVGGEVTLTATELPATYTWMKNGVVIEGANTNVLSDSPIAVDNDITTYNYAVLCFTEIPGCQSTTIDTMITVFPNHSVTISGDPILCNTNNVQLLATLHDTVQNATYEYQWMVDGVDVAGANNADFDQAMTERDYPYIFSVRVTNNISGCVAVSDGYYVYVDANPEVVVSASDTDVCENGVVTLTAHLGNYNTPNLTYVWKVDGTEIAGANEATYVATIDASHTYTAEVTQANSGCVGTGDITITKHDIPVVVLNIGTGSVTDSTICEGGQVTLIAHATADAELGDITFAWYENGVLLQGVTDSTYTVSPLVVDVDQTAHIYSVVAIAAAPACASEPATATVRVSANPEVLLYGHSIVCEAPVGVNNVQVNARIVTDIPFDPMMEHHWYVDGVEVIPAMGDEVPMLDGYFLSDHVDLQMDPHTYQLEVISSNGCRVTSDPFMVQVLAKPVVNVLVDDVDSTICDGGQITATAYLANPNATNITYQWLVDGDSIIGATTPILTTTLTGVATHEITVSVNQLVSDPDRYACRNTDVVEVEVVAAPEITEVEASADTICEGYQVNIHAVASNGVAEDGYTYTWYRNGAEMTGLVDSVIYDTPVATDGDTAMYIYTVVAHQISSGCNSLPMSDTVYVFPNPTVWISGDQIICDHGDIELHANLNDTALNLTFNYEWRLSNTTIGNNSRDLTIHDTTFRDEPYIFTVTVSNDRGCAVTSEPYYVYVNDSVRVEVTHEPDSVCPGAEVTFTANLIDYNADNLIYRWSEIRGTSVGDTTEIHGATSREVVVRPTTEIYRYQVEILQTTSMCKAIGFDSVKVLSPATLAWEEVSDTALCFGGEVSLTVTPPTNLEGYYTWYRNGQQITGANLNHLNDSPIAVDGDSTAYEYAVVFNPVVDGCRSEMIDTIVYVYPSPVIEITGDAIVCTRTDSNIYLIAHVSDTSVASRDFTYTWFESNREITATENLASEDTLLIHGVEFRDEPYIFTVVMSNNRGCTVTSAPYNVYVNDTVLVEVTSSVDSVCAGGEVTLEANLGDYNADNMIYRWYAKEEGAADSTEIWGGTSRIITVNPIKTTYYSVLVRQTTSECFAIGYDTIKVIAPTAIAINLGVDEGRDTLCNGGEVTLVATGEHGEALVGGSFIWTRNGVVIPGAEGPSITESPLAIDNDSTAYIYQVMYALDVPGCRADTADTTVIVYMNPTVQISGDPIICNVEGTENNLVLVANVNDTVHHDLTYEWRLANRTIEGATEDTLRAHLDASDNPYLFTVQVSNHRGCTTLSEEFPVYVNDTASIQVVVTSDYDTVCVGGEVTLTAHLADYNSGSLTFQWYKRDTTATGADTLIAIDYGTEPILHYTMTDSLWNYFELHITQTNSGCEAWGIDSVYVWPRVPYVISHVHALNIANNSHFICDGGEVDVQVELSDLNGNRIDSTLFTYNWYRNGFEHPFLSGPWFRESPLTVDGDTTHYQYSAVIVLDIPGCEYSQMNFSDTVTVVRNPIVYISGNPYVCQYMPINLFAWVNGDVAPLTTTYNWYLDGQLHNTYQSYRFYHWDSLAVSTGFAYNFMVEAVDANGCSGFSDPFQVVVVEAPVVHITATEDSVCVGGEVTFTANLDNYNLEYLQYQWYQDVILETNRIPGATNPTYTDTLNETHTYYVEVFSSLVANDALCTATDGYTVTVVPDPVVDSVTISVDDICEGGQVTVTAHTSEGIPSDAYTYTWFRNGILMEGITDSTFTESPMTVDGDITTYVYSAIASQVSSGCTSAQTFATDTLTVYPNPTVVIAGDPIICEDSVIMLSANVTNDYFGAELTYTWLLYNDTIRAPRTGVGADTIIDPRPAQDHPYIYTAVVNNPHGCLTESAPFYVYVNDTIIVEVTSSEDTICEGGSITLTANIGDYNADALTYRWYKNDTTAANEIWGATQSQLTIVPDSTMNYFVRVFQTTSDCETFGSYRIIVNPVPYIDTIELSINEICDGGQVTITAHPMGGVSTDIAPYVFTWYRNNEVIEGVTDSTFTESPLTVDGNITDYVYSATVHQAASGCESERKYADSILRVNPNPQVVISSDPLICEDDHIILHANVTDEYPTANLNFTWKLDNDTVADGLGMDTFDTLVEPRDHSYDFTVVVSNEHGCVTESAVYSVTVNPRPVVELTAFEDTICETGSTILRANVDNGFLTNLMYRWINVESGDTIYGGMQHELTVYPDSTTRYAVEVYQVGSECMSYDTITIKVNERPVIDSVILSDYEICDGGQVTVTAYTHGGVDTANVPYIYTWYRNGELVEGETGATFVVSPLTVDNNITDYVFSAVVRQDISGCVSDSTAAAYLRVNPNPYVVISSDPLICQYDSVHLYANVTDEYPTANLNFTWKLDNDTIADGLGMTQFDTLLEPRDHSYNFTVVVANDLGCVSMSDVYRLTVNPMPAVEITAYEEDICEGGSTVLTANIDNYNLTNLMYRWHKDSLNNPIDGDMQRIVTMTPDTTTMYFVEIYQVGSECVNVDSIEIRVHEIPVVDSVTLDFYEMCYGGQPTITAHTHGGVDTADYPYYYTWYRNGELIEGVTGETFTDNLNEIAVDNDDSYYVYTAVAHQIPSGCTSEPTSADRLNVYMNPRVEITGDPYVCQTDPVFVMANVDTSSITVGNLHFTWYESGQIRDNMAYGYGDSRYFSEYFYPRPNAYHMQVEVTRGNGCRTMSEPFDVYVHEAPVVSVTATETEICVGGTVTMTANLEDYHMVSDDDHIGDLTFQWYENSVTQANAIYGATLPTYTAANIDTTTTYYVKVFRTLSECFDIDQITINVHEDPTVTLAISDSDTVICAGGEFTLTASAVYDSILGVPTFTWSRNGVVLDNTFDSVFVDHPVTVDNDSVNYTYGVYVTLTASGCASTVSDSSTINVTVLPNATVQIEGDPVICGAGNELDTIHLVANVNDTSAFVDGFTYEWRLYNRTINAAQDSIIGRADSNVLDILVAPSLEPYVFTVHVWNENGCSTVSEEFPVYVNDTTSVVITASETEICVGGEVTLFANLGDYHVNNLTYQWIVNGDTIPGATSAEYTTTLDSTSTFAVNLVQTTSSCLSYNEITIYVHPDPVVTLAINDNDTVICDGGQVTLTATAVYDSILGPATFTWYRNHVEIADAHDSIYVESPLTVDGDVTTYEYSVMVTLPQSGCQSVITDSSTVTVTVNPNPTIEIEGDHNICGSGAGLDTIHLVANVNDTVTNSHEFTYEWRLFNTTIDQATTNVLDTFLMPNDEPYIFTAIVANENGCTTVSEPFEVYVHEAVEVVALTTEADICVGGTVTVSAHLNNYNIEGLTYQWLANGDTIDGATEATYTTTLDSTTTFEVLVDQPTTSCISNATVTVNVHADPTVTVAISDADTNICEGGQFTLTATAVYDTVLGEPTYTWYRNGVEVADATGAVLTESPVTVDGDITNYRYEVLVTLTASGCQSVITDSSTIDVHVYPNSTVEIEGDPIICGAGANTVSTVLTANLNDTVTDVDGYTFEWRLFNRTIDATDTNVNGAADSVVLDYNLTVSDNPYIFTVIVHNPNGCTNESAPFYVYVNDTADINVTVSEYDICEYGEVTFYANIGDYNMPNLTYQWYEGDTTNAIAGATQSTYITTLDTVGAHTYVVRVYQPTSNCVAYGENTVNVHADPTVTVAISDEDTTICEGGEFTITATATYDSILGTPVYTWFRNGVEITNATEATLTESPVTVDGDVTTYTYEVLVTLTANGCQSVITDSSTMIVTVLPNPTVEIAGDHSICGNGVGADHVILTANVNDTVADVDGFTYEWRLFNLTVGTENTIDTVLPSNDEPYIFTVIVRNENGCTTTSAPFEVLVNEPVVVTALSTEYDICEGGNVTVSAHLDNANIAGLTYQWVANGDTIPGATSPEYTTSLDSTTVFEVIVEQPTTSCISNAFVTVNVHPDPVVTVEISDEDTVICEGGEFTLTATAVYDEILGDVTYTWTKNGVVIAGANTNTLHESQVTVDNDVTNYTYTVVATLTASGCQSVVTDSSTINVTVLRNATVVIAGDPVICGSGVAATTVHLTANVNDTSDMVDGYNYEWRLFNETLAGENTNVLDMTLAPSVDPYTFTAVITNENGCGVVSAPFNVMVNAAPEVVITVTENDICEGGQTTLTATLGDYNTEFLTYQWQLNGVNIAGATQATYTTPDNLLDGDYEYTVIVRQTTSDCVSSDVYTITVHADPVITDITVSNEVICDGGQVVVTATGNYDAELGDPIYTWYRNGVLLPGITSNTFTDYPTIVDDQTTFTYSAVVTLAASGCTSAEAFAPVVTVNEHATITVTTTGSQTVCEGGNVMLTANVDPADNYTYQWYIDNQPVGQDTNVFIAQGLAARETPYMIHVIVEGAAGCITSTMGEAVPVTVVADPIVTLVDVTNAGASTVCVGGTATLTASYEGGVAQINGLGTPTYTWFNNGEQVGTGNTYVIPDTLAAGSYAYTVVMSFADNAYGCDVNTAVQGNTGIYNFTVVDDPTPFIAIHVDNDSIVCVGGTTELYVHHVDGGLENAQYNYQWYRNGIILPGATQPTLVTDANLTAGNYEYQVIVTMDGVACDGASNTITIPVVATPVATIDGAANVCFGGQVTMTATVDTTYGDNVTYQWIRNGQPIDGATQSTYTTDATLNVGNYEYQVVVINTLSGCQTTSGIVAAHVVADPTVVVLGAESVCQGGTITLVADIAETVPGTTYNYAWYRDNAQVGSNASTYVTDASLAAGTYNYFVEVTPAGMSGCNATSAMVQAVVLAGPTATISGFNEVCEGGSVVLSANVYPTSTYNYTWYLNGVELTTQNAATLTTDATLAVGTYTYAVEASNNMYNSCVATAQFTYTVAAEPVIDSIVSSLPNNQMCEGGAVTLTASMSNGTNAANVNTVYHWAVNGHEIVGANGATFTETINVPGTYTYTVYATQGHNDYNTGCESETQSIVIEVLEQPFVGISYSGMLQVCEGGYVELSAIIEGGIGTPNIIWRRNNARITEFDNMVTIHTDTTDAVGGPYTYSVSVNYPQGSGCVATSDNVDVYVLYQPRWEQTVVTPADVCLGDRVDLFATVAGGVEDANHQTGTFIQWVYAPVSDLSDVSNVTGGLGGLSYDITTSAGIYTYYPTYVAPANTNCMPSNTPNATTVTVHEHPTATMYLGEGSDVLCWNDADDNATLTIVFHGTAPFYFTLTDVTHGISTNYVTNSNVYSIELTPNSTTTYQLTALSDLYCSVGDITDATVTIVVSQFEIVNDSVAICPDEVGALAVFQFNNLTVNDDRDTIWYEIVDYNNIGFDYTGGMIDLDNNTVSIWMPTTEPGTYQFGIVIDGCMYDVTVTILWGATNGINIMDQKWDDVVVCNNNPATNGGHTFVSFQWYRNGEPIPGATHQYYQEIGGLNGIYSLWVLDDQGNEYWTCEMIVATNPQLRVYPVPAHVGVEITVELPLSAEELDGAVLDIFDAKGALVQHVTNLQQITRVAGFEAQGTYFGRITTGTNTIETVKFVIVK